jgi:imidazolonepropionase-like amidohydrolase
MRKERGTIEPGKIADLVIWNAEHPAELAAQFGLIRPAAILRDGVQ